MHDMSAHSTLTQALLCSAQGGGGEGRRRASTASPTFSFETQRSGKEGLTFEAENTQVHKKERLGSLMKGTDTATVKARRAQPSKEQQLPRQ